MNGKHWKTATGAILLCLAASLLAIPRFTAAAGLSASAPPSEVTSSNAFPEPYEVLQGRTFTNTLERDLYFLRGIHDRYAPHWPALLRANITVRDYLLAPDKLKRFVEELGTAMEGADDKVAVTNLALVITSPEFFANTNGYHPETQRAAASALIKLGAKGRETLASAFTEAQYRLDPQGLEELADVIGAAGNSDPKLAQALAATAFTFTATNGGSFPHCTQTAARNLLRLPDGAALAAKHFNPDEVFRSLGRFQAVMDGLAEARASDLSTNLTALEKQATAKLAGLTNNPGPYRDALLELDSRIKRAVSQLQTPRPDSNPR